MSKARQLAQKPSQPTGRKNLLINGAMQVAQRGTSQTTTGYGSVDRWYIDNTADGGGQVADAPDDFEYSLKINPDSGNGVARQAIELPAAGKGGVFRSGQTFTLSFWLKSDNAGEAINIFVASSSIVNGTTTTHVSDGSTGLTTSTSWTRYTYTYTQASDVGVNDTCYNIVPYVSTPSGAIYITGVQLEVGSTATEFEHRSYGEELLSCYRYLYKWDSGASQDVIATISGYSTTRAFGMYYLPVEMHHDPEIEISGNFRVRMAHDRDVTSGPSVNRATTRDVQMYVDYAASGSAGFSGWLKDKDNTAQIIFEAEL